MEYGLEEERAAAPEVETPAEEDISEADEPVDSVKVLLTVEVAYSTKREIERRAAAAELSVGKYLDREFRVKA